MLILDGLRRWTAQRRDMRALYALSTRELKDIGVSRSDIPKLVARKR